MVRRLALATVVSLAAAFSSGASADAAQGRPSLTIGEYCVSSDPGGSARVVFSHLEPFSVVWADGVAIFGGYPGSDTELLAEFADETGTATLTVGGWDQPFVIRISLAGVQFPPDYELVPFQGSNLTKLAYIDCADDSTAVCKNGGWPALLFNSQGACVASVASGGSAGWTRFP